MVLQKLGIGRKIWQSAGKEMFHRNMDSAMTIGAGKEAGTGKFGDWQENMVCGRKIRVHPNMDLTNFP